MTVLVLWVMLKTIPGTFESGVVRLGESVPDLPEGPVLVTFLETKPTGSATPVLTPAQVADLRGKLGAWEEDWNAPGMEAYD
jgi:hypothetical protein